MCIPVADCRCFTSTSIVSPAQTRSSPQVSKSFCTPMASPQSNGRNVGLRIQPPRQDPCAASGWSPSTKPIAEFCMKILALEFSSTQRSAAVVSADAAKLSLVTSEVLESGSNVNSLALIEEALKKAALEREQ